MKKILIVTFCLATFASASAAGSKKENKAKDVKVKIDIHTDKSGNVHIDGKINNEKELEKWLNEALKNVTVQIDDDKGKSSKNVEVSLTIKEK